MSVGIDLVDIGRLERALTRRPNLAHRLFTPQELEYAHRHHRPAQRLAARFAAKEAVTKALALPYLSPLDIEVHSGAPPTVTLTGIAAAPGLEVDISLTHEREIAAAVATTRERTPPAA